MKRKNKARPPRVGQWILKKILPSEERQYLVEGIEERYVREFKDRGWISALFWYLKDILCTIPLLIIDNFTGSGIMFKNYLKIAFRNIKKYKGYSFINIAGLVIGLTAFILIFLYIRYELSYDRFHKNADRIYRVYMHQKGNLWHGTDLWNVTPPILAPTLKNDFPEIVTSVRLYKDRSGKIINIEDNTPRRVQILYADPEFLEMFNFPMIKGNSETALSDPYSLLITEKASVKYFGNEKSIGRIINIKSGNGQNYSYKITGIMKDIPGNSHINFEFLSSIQTLFTIGNIDPFTYRGNFTKTYIQFHANYDVKAFEKKLQEFNTRVGRVFRIQPMTEIHLYGNLNVELESNSDIKYIYIFSAIAVFILLIACLNYLNLSTAHASKRTREVGLRKVIGADKSSIIKQFLGESFFLTAIAFLISIFLVKTLLPVFNAFIERKISFGIHNDLNLILSLILLLVVTALIAGSYPAFYVSSFQPVKTLKEYYRSGSKRGLTLRNSLVVIQFVITIVMIISTITVFRQMQFIRNKKLGFEYGHIINIPLARNFSDKFDEFKNECTSHSYITEATLSNTPINVKDYDSAEWEGKEDETTRMIYKASVDYNFIDFYNIDIIEGRKFSRNMATDNTAYILNETAVRDFGIKNPIGKIFRMKSRQGTKGTIIGIIKDFHFHSLHLKIAPLALKIEPAHTLSLKIHPKDFNLQDTMTFIENKYKQFFPGHVFEYTFLDENIERMYIQEKKGSQIFNNFTFLAIFIACLGLYGLVLNMIEQRTKEIGIRKVLGASVSGVSFLLMKSFLRQVIIANLIAIPLGWFIMQRWLENFAYRAQIGPLVFAASAFLVVGIALLTVSYRAIRAATANPVDSLRYE